MIFLVQRWHCQQGACIWGSCFSSSSLLNSACYFTCQCVEPKCKTIQARYVTKENQSTAHISQQNVSVLKIKPTKVLMNCRFQREDFNQEYRHGERDPGGEWPCLSLCWLRKSAPLFHFSGWWGLERRVRRPICNLKYQATAATYVPALCCSSWTEVLLGD